MTATSTAKRQGPELRQPGLAGEISALTGTRNAEKQGTAIWRVPGAGRVWENAVAVAASCYIPLYVCVWDRRWLSWVANPWQTGSFAGESAWWTPAGRITGLDKRHPARHRHAWFNWDSRKTCSTASRRRDWLPTRQTCPICHARLRGHQAPWQARIAGPDWQQLGISCVSGRTNRLSLWKKIGVGSFFRTCSALKHAPWLIEAHSPPPLQVPRQSCTAVVPLSQAARTPSGATLVCCLLLVGRRSILKREHADDAQRDKFLDLTGVFGQFWERRIKKTRFCPH